MTKNLLKTLLTVLILTSSALAQATESEDDLCADQIYLLLTKWSTQHTSTIHLVQDTINRYTHNNKGDLAYAHAAGFSHNEADPFSIPIPRDLAQSMRELIELIDLTMDIQVKLLDLLDTDCGNNQLLAANIVEILLKQNEHLVKTKGAETSYFNALGCFANLALEEEATYTPFTKEQKENFQLILSASYLVMTEIMSPIEAIDIIKEAFTEIENGPKSQLETIIEDFILNTKINATGSVIIEHRNR